MSHMGQKQTYAPQQTATLLDHLVGGGEKLRMEFQAERLGGPEVDDELDFVGPYHQQVAGLLAPLRMSAGVNPHSAGRRR